MAIELNYSIRNRYKILLNMIFSWIAKLKEGNYDENKKKIKMGKEIDLNRNKTLTKKHRWNLERC
tara:strand:+ start:357 stop:551 length:195 start_codon:yes stop_codon:yes gene_type:complete